MLRTLDHILNLRLILFPDGLIHFLISKYASPALMFSVKTRSTFEKYLRLSFFMRDFLLVAGNLSRACRSNFRNLYLLSKVVLVHIFGGPMEKYVNLFNFTSLGFEIRIMCKFGLYKTT